MNPALLRAMLLGYVAGIAGRVAAKPPYCAICADYWAWVEGYNQGLDRRSKDWKEPEPPKPLEIQSLKLVYPNNGYMEFVNYLERAMAKGYA